MAQSKDIITKDILKQIARDLSKYILNIPIQDEIELIEKEFTRVEKRDADLLFKNGDKIIHIEIQNNNHPKMDKRMLRYYSDLLFEYEDFMIQQFIIYIGKDKCSMKNEIKRDKISYNYDIIDMKNIACEEFLQSKDPSAISLSILCDFKNRDKQEVVNTILRKLISTCKDETEFRSHLKMVEVLSTNRDLEDKVRKGEEMLTVDIEKIPSYNIGLERGIKKGLQEGIKKGIEKGIEEGIEKGIEEGQIEAKINIAKNALKHGFDVKTVISLTGLSKEKVLEIKDSL